MGREPMRESDLRSLNRKSMYLSFAPLDPNERLPRELLDEGPPPRRMSLLASTYDQPGRKELAAVIWLPAVVLILVAARLGWLNALMTMGALGLLAIGLIGLALGTATPRRQ
jgi:hypothetical protein